MADWLKRFTLVAAAFGFVWVAAIAVWRATAQTPGTVEIAFYLLGLPIVLILSVWAGSTMMRRMRDAPDAPPEVPVQDPALADGAPRENEERSWFVHIAGAAIRCAHGSTCDELSEKLDSGKTELTLDRQLADLDGFPILTGRITSLDKSDLLKELVEWIAIHGNTDLTWRDEELRALALGGDAARELADRIAAHPLLPDYLAMPPAKRGAVALPALQLMACLPPWHDDKRKLALAWFSQLLEQQKWPSEKIIISPQAAAHHAHPMQWIDWLCLTTRRQSLPCLALLVTCMSDLGEETVSNWCADNRLLTAHNKNGSVPGEGAAALLIMDAQQSALFEDSKPTVMHRLAQTQRDKPIDESRRVSTELLTALANDAMAVAGIKSEDIGVLISDNNQSTNRTTEIMLTGAEMLPELDPATAYAATGVLCATRGAVSTTLALALAHHKSKADRVSALCVSNQQALECYAAVMKPADADTIAQQ